MGKVSSVVDTILGEALAGDYQDMLGIVSVIDNRSKATGVSYKDVVSVPSQFNAYGKAMPKGVEAYRDLAKQAIAEVQAKGPVHAATFYATPAEAKGLPKGLVEEARSGAHTFYSDPKGRAIATTQGYKSPDLSKISLASRAVAMPEVGPVPTARPDNPATAVAYEPKDPTRGRGLAALTSPESRRSAQQAHDAARSPFDSILSGTRSAPDPSVALEDRGTLGRGMLSGFVDMTDDVDYGRTATANAQPFSSATVHHAEPTTLSALRSVTNTPRSSGAYLGYSIAVDPQGNVAQLAPMDARTNHIGGFQGSIPGSTNANSLGLAFTDAFGPITDESITAAGEAIAAVNRAGSFGFIDPDNIGYHGKGATGTRSVEGKAEAEAIQSYLGGLPFGPNHTPTPTPAPRNDYGTAPVTTVSMSPLAGLMGVAEAPAANRGFAGPAVSFNQPGLTTNIDQANLTASITPTQRGRVDPTQAQMAALSKGLQEQARGIVEARAEPAPTRGRVDPTAAQMADLARGLQDQARGIQEAPIAASLATTAPAQTAPTRSVTDTITAMTPDIGMPTQGPSFGPQMSAVAAKEEGILDGLEQAAAQQAAQQATAPATAPAAPTATAPAAPSIAAYSPAPAQEQQGPLSALAGLLGVENVTKSVGKGLRSNVGKAGMRGAGVGAMFGGIPGGVLGALLGIAIAQHRDPAKTFARSYQSGLGFPEAPKGPDSQGGLTAYGEAASRGDFGGQAQTAADNPGTGLF